MYKMISPNVGFYRISRTNQKGGLQLMDYCSLM